MPLVAKTKRWNVPQSYTKIGGGKEMSNTESNLSWIRTSDIYEYDVINAFKNFKEIDWRKSSFSVKKGDTVYIYVGKPYSKIMFKTLCVKDDVLPEETIDDRVFYVSNGERVVDNAYIRLRLLDTIRWKELREFNRFIDSKECYMKQIRNALDDATAEDCGRCSNCIGKHIFE
jgi:hypothetical protein